MSKSKIKEYFKVFIGCLILSFISSILVYIVCILMGNQLLKINIDYLSGKSIAFYFFIWIVILGFLIWAYTKIKGSKSNKGNIASGSWMGLQEFNSKYETITLEEDSYSGHGWVFRSELINASRNREIFKVSYMSAKGHFVLTGGSGAGKTVFWVVPQIRFLASSKTPSSMLLTDPKGELYRDNSKWLEKRGYNVQVINLRDWRKSDYWNPLAIIWDTWFKDSEDNLQKEEFHEEAISKLDSLGNSIFTSASDKDRMWVNGANSIFKAFVLFYLEQAEKFPKKYTKNKFNINTIYVNLQQGSDVEKITELIKNMDEFSESLAVGGGNMMSAEATVKGFISQAASELAIYSSPSVKRVTCKTTLKWDPNKPTALFIIVPDEERTLYPLITLFIAQFYKDLIQKATSFDDGKLPVPWYFLLDEFGNTPKWNAADSALTVARSRNIYIALIIQNIEQLNTKYGKDNAITLLANCSVEMMMLTSAQGTAEEFSRKLGDKEITVSSTSNSSGSKSNSNSVSDSQRARRLMTPDEIQKLKMGQIIIKAQREKPINTSLVPSYKVNKITNTYGAKEYAEHKNFSYKEKHLYLFINDLSKSIPKKDKKKEKTKAPSLKGMKVKRKKDFDPLK